MVRTASTVLILALALGGCASRPDNPPPSLAAARVAVNDANPETVNRYAPTEMQEARGYLERAEASWRANDQMAATRLADQALASLRLAEARADAAQAREAEQDVLDSLDAARPTMTAPVSPGAGEPVVIAPGTGVATPPPVQPAPTAGTGITPTSR